MEDISKYDLRYVVKAYASFELSGAEINPDEISLRLGLVPFSIEVKGKRVELPNGNFYISDENMWRLQSTVDSLDVNDHLKELLDRLENSEVVLLESMGKPCFTLTYLNNHLHCGSGPTLESDVIRRIGKFKAEIAFDIYQVDQNFIEKEE